MSWLHLSLLDAFLSVTEGMPAFPNRLGSFLLSALRVQRHLCTQDGPLNSRKYKIGGKRSEKIGLILDTSFPSPSIPTTYFLIVQITEKFYSD